MERRVGEGEENRFWTKSLTGLLPEVVVEAVAEVRAVPDLSKF